MALFTPLSCGGIHAGRLATAINRSDLKKQTGVVINLFFSYMLNLLNNVVCLREFYTDLSEEGTEQYEHAKMILDLMTVLLCVEGMLQLGFYIFAVLRIEHLFDRQAQIVIIVMQVLDNIILETVFLGMCWYANTLLNTGQTVPLIGVYVSFGIGLIVTIVEIVSICTSMKGNETAELRITMTLRFLAMSGNGLADLLFFFDMMNKIQIDDKVSVSLNKALLAFVSIEVCLSLSVFMLLCIKKCD